jgi:hypothetical protein
MGRWERMKSFHRGDDRPESVEALCYDIYGRAGLEL